MPEGITVNIDENPRVYRRTNVYCPVARPSEEYNDSTSEQGFYLDPELMQKIRTVRNFFVGVLNFAHCGIKRLFLRRIHWGERHSNHEGKSS